MSVDQERDDSLPALPPALQDRLFAVLFGDPEQREQAFRELLERHPDRAEALQAHRAHFERLPPGADGSRAAGDETTIPGYRLLEVLGEGGMGTVYLAEQKEPVRRRVALKLIKLGMDSKAVLARFSLERQALAVMNHDAIARIYDCGITDRGQSYFVMELVEGEPMTAHCDKHKLSLRQRIDIFQQVCAGIQHAHQKGVLHRDLKPGNVLVAKKGEKHVAKIIDFGIARATNHQLVDQTIFTEQGVMVGTPEYMSPEQACGDSQHIDTRTDVYSLGVMLYELLVGDLPFSSVELRQAGLLEIQRKLREDEPPKPSTKLTTRHALAREWAQNRNITVEGLRKELRHDLDWVALKAMAKEPERRYESAAALAEDLGRYLVHEPLRAGPPGASYRFKKLVRRYRVQVVTASLVLLALIGGGIGTFVQYLRAEDQRTKAESNEKLANQRAEQNASLAQSLDGKVREFNQLAVVVLYDRVIANEKDLYPSWPHKVAAMEKWLEDDAGPLLAMRPEIERTVRDLGARALTPTAEEAELDRRAHPRFAEYEMQDRHVASLRHAQAIRDGAPLVVQDLSEAQQVLDARALNMFAWQRVAPRAKAGEPEKRTVFGEETLGLAAARLAATKATGTPQEFQILDTLAWALVANGQDAEAMQASQRAYELAPPKRKAAFEDRLHSIENAAGEAASVLATAEQELAALSAVLGERRTWRIEEESQRLLHKELAELLGKLETLQTKQKVEVEQRLFWARQVQQLSLAHPNSKHTWAAVRSAIAQNPMYAGQKIELRDQDITGLVPIGENPATHLWEFYELRSAWDGKQEPRTIAIPAHEPNGSINVTDDTGIVFVLLPGGAFLMGSRGRDEDGPNFDPDSERRESPVHEVTLAPFFLARHEMTRRQWQRLTATRGFWWKEGESREDDPPIGPTHPADSMNWNDANRWMERHGLVLPTEAQWEYGCRAGTTTPWWSGPEAKDLQGCANVHDQTSVKHYPDWGTPAPITDGFTGIAPVGSFRDNPWGLFDVHGNVLEWCRDFHGAYDVGVHTGDGLRMEAASGSRVVRGGGYGGVPSNARSANRMWRAPSLRSSLVGVRPARALIP